MPKIKLIYFVGFTVVAVFCVFNYLLIINYCLENDDAIRLENVSVSSLCETIHIGIVCTGYKQNLKFYILLKSIYFYRSKPLHFHLMVDDISFKSVETLFNTWNVPQVSVTYYNETVYKEKMHWTSSAHYLHTHGFIKLLLANSVPTSMTNKVIVLDTDLLFAADISELWSIFEEFNEQQAIGLIERQGKQFHIQNDKQYHNNKFNTGVALYHLKKLESINWPSVWMEVAQQILDDVQIAKQDILNFILNPSSTLIYTIPCQWNIQINSGYNSIDCYLNNKIKVVHQNFLKEWKGESSFQSMHDMIYQYSGNFLTQNVPVCNSSLALQQSTITSSNQVINYSILAEIPSSKSPIRIKHVNRCIKFDKEIALNRRTLLYFRNFNYVPTDSDVTLATQCSYDKLILMGEKLCGKWKGPISLTIYVSDDELQKAIAFIENSTYFKYRSNIAWNAVFKNGRYYPMNDLRNVSLRTVVTPFVFLVDMDLMPTDTLYDDIKIYVDQIDNFDKKAFIIPAFETQGDFPSTKEKVIQMAKNKTLKIFHNDYIKAYGPTNYTTWVTAEAPYLVDYKLHFEPYIVVKSDVVEYDRRFIGFGFNKASHIMHLDAQGYEFIVLPELFVVHKYHLPSVNLRENLVSSIYRKCKVDRMSSFAAELHDKYNKTYDIMK